MLKTWWWWWYLVTSNIGLIFRFEKKYTSGDYFHLRNTYVPYTFLFSFFMSFFGMYQIRFGEHRKTNSNRIWYNVCTIFGWKVYHIRSEYGTNVPYSAEYGTFVPYTFLYQILSDKASQVCPPVNPPFICINRVRNIVYVDAYNCWLK